MIRIEVKKPRLIAGALGEESSSGNVKCCCKKSSFKQFESRIAGLKRVLHLLFEFNVCFMASSAFFKVMFLLK